MVVFERSESDAQRTEAKYRAIRPTDSIPPDATIDIPDEAFQRQRNALVLWFGPATHKAFAQIEECLRT